MEAGSRLSIRKVVLSGNDERGEGRVGRDEPYSINLFRLKSEFCARWRAAQSPKRARASVEINKLLFYLTKYV